MVPLPIWAHCCGPKMGDCCENFFDINTGMISLYLVGPTTMEKPQESQNSGQASDGKIPSLPPCQFNTSQPPCCLRTSVTFFAHSGHLASDCPNPIIIDSALIL
ncbi:UNVERIFIED_CONTAM: hypothetical protein K2H54_038611 [Gekko kuhli]